MKITDLRVNNYVLYREQIVRVKEISTDAAGNYVLTFDDDRQSNLKSVEPVAITQERLSRLGFREIYRSKDRVRFELPEKFLKYDIDLCLNKILEGLMVYGNYIECAGIHHLQNLYQSLLGKDLSLQERIPRNRIMT